MKRRRIPEWAAEFERLRAEEIFAQFDEMALEQRLADEQAEKTRIRRERNLRKALRIRSRLYVAQDFDIWANPVEIDEWGDLRPRDNRVKANYVRKAKLIWVLATLYNYWAFDLRPVAGFKVNKRTMTHSYLCDLYDKYLGDLDERVRQDNWDRKRAKVRARREAVEKGKIAKPFDHPLKGQLSEVLTLRYGIGSPTITIKARPNDFSAAALAQELNPSERARILIMSQVQIE